MSLSKLSGLVANLVCGAMLLMAPALGHAQTNYFAANGSEYAVVGSLPGDQVLPDVNITPVGGYLVWQDNVTDGSGSGISAEKLTSTFSGTLSSFRVNVQSAGNQQNAHVATLKNGGAAFVWQGGPNRHQQIFARFLSPSNIWLSTTDLVVSTFTNTFQTTPALAVLNNSNVVVVWASFNQAGTNSALDVYGKILSASGQTVSNSFLINQFTNFNQRNPSVSALANGGFVVAWVSEQQLTLAPTYGNGSSELSVKNLTTPSVDIYARLYQSNGVPVGNEFIVNQTGNPAATPVVAPSTNGGFLIAWSGKDLVTATNSWDIYARPFSATGAGSSIIKVNTHLYGDQYYPRINAIGNEFLVVWTSLAQDGSREGVFGQFLHANGSMVGTEFQVNTTTQDSQMQAAVASDGVAWFQVVWTSFTGLANGFDLYSQLYANTATILQPMSPPAVVVPFNLVSNLYAPQLQVSWPLLQGISVSNYSVYVDGSLTSTTNLPPYTNYWVMGSRNGLTAGSTHSFAVGYSTTDGRVAPISRSTAATTWSGQNYQGIPLEWLEAYYGFASNNFPPNVNAPLVHGGPSLANLFLTGGNPTNSSTWLTTAMVRTKQGVYLTWNCQPGLTYQVQSTTNLANWSTFGAPRYEAGTNDSIYLGNASVGYFRVQLLRQ